MRKLSYKHIFLAKIILIFILLIVFVCIYFYWKKTYNNKANRILFVVDVSNAMAVEDIFLEDKSVFVSRLSGAKIFIENIFQNYLSWWWEVWLLIFAKNSELLLPFTKDYDTFYNYLSSLLISDSGMVWVESGSVWDAISKLELENIIFLSSFGFDYPEDSNFSDKDIVWINMWIGKQSKFFENKFIWKKYSFLDAYPDISEFMEAKIKVFFDKEKILYMWILLFLLLFVL